jgi:type I restriction enzyme S subunit
MKTLPKGWKEEKLSELIDKIIDYRGKTPKKLGLDWSEKGKYKALSAKSVKTGGLVNEEQINLGNEELYKAWMKDEVEYNDILLTSEAPMGEVIIWKSEEKIILSQRLFAIRVKENISPDYMYYYFISKTFQSELLARSSGTTVVGIKQTELLKTNVILPESPDEQKEIASILSSFDKKIELLKEQNHTLETMAQTIFKEWFVDFNYPNATGEMIDSEMGEIPKGWRVGIFDEIIEFINGYAFKSDELEKVEDIDSYAIFKMGHIKKGGGFNPTKTKDYISKNQCTKLEKYILKSGDILMCMTDMKDSTSLLGHTALMFEDEKYIVNQRVGLIHRLDSENSQNYQTHRDDRYNHL